MLGVVGVIGSIVAWIYAIVDLVKREETNESKLLWALLIVFVAPIGHIIYFFMEDRRKWGIASIIFPIALVIMLIMWPLMQLLLINL